jgi:hypothetical protein
MIFFYFEFFFGFSNITSDVKDEKNSKLMTFTYHQIRIRIINV